MKINKYSDDILKIIREYVANILDLNGKIDNEDDVDKKKK